MLSSGELFSGASYWAPVAVESLWKTTLILFAAAAAAWQLRRSSAASRHLIWTLAVVAALTMPLGIAFVPTWRLTVLPRESATAFAEPIGTQPERSAADGSAFEAQVRVPPGTASGTPTPSATPTPTRTVAAAASPMDVQGLLFSLWLFGVAVILSWIATGLIAVARMARRAHVLSDPEWATLLGETRGQLGVRRKVVLLEATGNVTPMTFGLWSNLILLPAESRSWSSARKRAVLLHELAHVERRDVLVQVIAQLACALYWFHPLVWHAAARLRRERERACDDAVVRAGERPSEYATHLLEVARAYHAAPLLQPAALAMARASQLEGRLLAVLKPGLNRARVSRRRIAASVTAGFAVVLPLSALTPITRSQFAVPQQTATVYRHPRPSEPLAARWDWAFGEAARRRSGFWVAYSVSRTAPASQAFISSSGGFDMRELQLRPLQTQLFGTIPADVRRTDRTTRVPHEVALMFQFGRGAADLSDASVTRIHSLRMGIDLDDLPVYWLGAATDEQSIAWLRQQFESTTVASIRDELVEAVGIHERSDLAVPFLQRVLREETSERLRAQAAEALGEQGSTRAVQALREVVVSDRSLDVRREAAEALGQSSDQSATRTLIEVASSSSADLDVRVEAAEALGEQGTEEAARALEQLIFEADDVDIQRKATEALGNLPGTLGLVALRRTVRSHMRWEIRAEAAETLGDLPPSTAVPLLEQVAFEDPDQRVQEEAAEALGDLGRAAIPALRRIIDSHPDREVRSKAAEALGDVGRVEPAAEPEHRDQDDVYERERLDVQVDRSSLITEAEARNAPDARAIFALRESLSHVSTGEHDLVRERAEWALSLITNGEVVGPLIAALRDPEWRVRAYAAWALGVADDARAADALLVAATDSHWRVRMHAMFGLGELNASPRTADLLIVGLEDATWQVRAIAAQYLGEIRATGALEPLRRRLDDNHIAVRGAAEQAILQITGS